MFRVVFVTFFRAHRRHPKSAVAHARAAGSSRRSRSSSGSGWASRREGGEEGRPVASTLDRLALAGFRSPGHLSRGGDQSARFASALARLDYLLRRRYGLDALYRGLYPAHPRSSR